MAHPELNLITAASMGDLEAVQRLMKLEPPGASQRQTLVFAALKDQATCIEALLPICDQQAIDDAFVWALKEAKFVAATVLLPHVANPKHLNLAVGRSVLFNQREFFSLALAKACSADMLNNPHERDTPYRFGIVSEVTRFWTWFYEEAAVRQRDVLNDCVDAGGRAPLRKI